MWDDALAGVQRHLVTSARNLGVKLVAELPQGVGGRLSPKMDHLICFLPGTVAMAVSVSLLSDCVVICIV